MKISESDTKINEKELRQAEELFNKHQLDIYKSTDRMFAILMMCQWIGGIILALLISPVTWAGSTMETHIHVYAALFLGGIITAFPVILALVRPGWVVTRHVIAVGQTLTSALLIHLTGGRIETHFHVFGSLAFLAFYRDWRVLITATIVVAIDHGIRGVIWPQSVYGIITVQEWRFAEHAGWVMFEDIFLFISIRRGINEMKDISVRQSILESTNRIIEQRVEERTAELLNAKNELEDSYRQLREANDKVVESERIKSEFMANISHELRTPLTLTLAPIESFLAGEYGDLSDSHRQTLKIMHNNSTRLLQMVNALLDFSKLEAGKIQVNHEPIQIVQLTGSIYHDFEPLMKHRGLHGSIELPSDENVVKMDRYLYERILFNLMSNAVKFTPSGGKITVVLSLDGDKLKVSVSDTGQGIKESELSNLFRRFYQAEGSSTRRFEGTGLGLALVKEFSNLLGGDVFVKSSVGKGSTFTVELIAPKTKAVGVDLKLKPKASVIQKYVVNSVSSNGNEHVRNNLPRVLIAEDNPELASYISKLLCDFCQVEHARDGEEALEMVDRFSPDLIISDVMMPRCDGFSLCREIKFVKSREIPVVLLTALTHRDSLLKGWEAGADEYLFKPFHPKELVMRIKTLLKNVQLSKQVKQNQLALIQSEKMAAIGQLAAGIAHEINNPLGVILGFSQSVKSRLKPDEPMALPVNHIEREAKRCKELVHNLLVFARTIKPEDREEIDLNENVDSALSLVMARAKMSKITLVKKLGEKLPMVTVNKTQIQQIVINLCNNAIDAMPEGGTLTVRTTLDEKEGFRWLSLEVTDTGIGISDEIRSQIFDPFFTTKDVGKGTGLGLSLVYEIVKKHGGTLHFDTKVGKGTTFICNLPAEK